MLLISILLAGRLSTLGVTLPAAEDSYGFRAKLSSVANKTTTLPVDATHRAFLYFDLGNELPANTQIRYARLRIYFPKVTRAGEGIAVHQVTGTWDESLASSEPTFTATPFASFPPLGMGTKRFVSVDVTNVVQSWIATPATNEGFAITALPGATAKLTASVFLGAKEGAGSGYPAELDIEIATDPIATGAIGTVQLASGAVTDEKIVTVSGGKVFGTVADAAAVSGIGVSVNPAPNFLLPLDGTGKFPGTVLPVVGSSILAPNLALAGITTGSFSGDGAGLTNVSALVGDGAIGIAKLDPVLAALLANALPRPLEFVSVGNAGNVADTAVMTSDSTTGYGSVAYSFQIGKFEVTNDQYVEFLNAVAATDPNGLFGIEMAARSDSGIVQEGAWGGFIYSVKARMRLLPVVYVNWLSAVRFCNWLHNGKPTGSQGPSTTEDGAYTFSGGTVVGSRNPTARYFLPNENEWYKAAYFDPAKVVGPGYWVFPTRSNSAPTAIQPNPTDTNSANFSGVGEVTPVGGYVLSVSAYGTFDQGGNVQEWLETTISGMEPGLRGGDRADSSARLESTHRNHAPRTISASSVGFRVAKQ